LSSIVQDINITLPYEEIKVPRNKAQKVREKQVASASVVRVEIPKEKRSREQAPDLEDVQSLTS
jgi:hypothetical protein